MNRRFEYIPRTVIPFLDPSPQIDQEVLNELISLTNLPSLSNGSNLTQSHDGPSTAYKLLLKKKTIKNAYNEEACKQIDRKLLAGMIHLYQSKFNPAEYSLLQKKLGKLARVAGPNASSPTQSRGKYRKPQGSPTQRR